MAERTLAKFDPGNTVATVAVMVHCTTHGINPAHYLDRHLQGDWGDVGDHDKRTNDRDLELGERLLSRYQLPTGRDIYIITEWGRSHPTVLFVEEY